MCATPRVSILSPLTPLAVWLLPVVILVVVYAGSAHAQTVQPFFGGTDQTPPAVYISPGSQAIPTGTVQVTIEWCDNKSLFTGSRSITLNGTSVTSSFGYTSGSEAGCGAYGVSTGTISLPAGQSTLHAQITDQAGNIGSSSVTYTYTPAIYGAQVTPDGQAATAYAGRSTYQYFTVSNPGNVQEQFNLTATCTGGVTGCPASLAPVTVGDSSSTQVWVPYQGGGQGDTTGRVTLRATVAGHTTVTDTGYINVTVNWPSYMTLNTAFTNNDNQDRSLCANNCFTAVYSQETVPYTSLDAPRNITLVYHGDRVAVRPFVYADVSLASDASPIQQYQMQVKVNGAFVTFVNGETALHFTGNQTQQVRLAGQFDASSYATGVYPMQIIVTATYSNHTESQTVTTQLVVVNERHSPIARGWTVAGVSGLYPQSDGTALITEGDGSATYFSTDYPGHYITPPGDFSHLTVSGSGSSTIYTRSFPSGSKEVYNNLGQLTARIDRLPDTTAFEYDSVGRLVVVRDPYRTYNTQCYDCGGPLIYHSPIRLVYGASGLSQIIEPNQSGFPNGGRVTTLVVASDSTLHAIQDPDGLSTSFAYDAQRRLSTVADRRGDTTRYVYDPISWKLDSLVLPRVALDAGNGTTTLSTPATRYVPWQSVGVPTSSTSNSPATPVLPSNVRAQVTDPGGHTTSYTVDRWGQPLSITDAIGRVTSITRSGIFAIRVIYPSGTKDSASYNSDGLLTYSAPAGTSPTTITYGAFALPTAISGPNQPSQTFVYGAQGRDSIATIAGATTHYYADALGRDTLVVDPAGHRTHLHYETSFGNLDSTTANGGQTTVVRFDAYGRDSVRRVGTQPAVTTVYDLMNRVISTTRDADGGATTVAYDGMGQPTRLQDAKGQVYRTEYNALGYPTQRYDAADTLGRFVSYRYNADGLLTSLTNRRGQRIDLTYDQVHRLIAKGDAATVADSFAYNTAGTVTVSWNAVSRDSVFTNASTNWTDSVVTYLNGQRFRRYYRPTALQQLDLLTIQGPSTISFSSRENFWDSNTGLLNSINVGGRVFTYHYNAELLRDSIVYPGSIKQGISYTTVHQPMELAFPATALDTVFNRSYGYDTVGHVVHEYGKIENGTGLRLRTFGYDGLNELAAVASSRIYNDTTCTDPEDPHALTGDFGYNCTYQTTVVRDQTNGYQYDKVGNLMVDTDSTHQSATQGAYLAGNRQTAWGGLSYTYDLDGNRTSRTSASGTVTYHWTADGLLDTVRSGSLTLVYAYNASGQLVRRSRNGVPDRYFLWDQDQLIAELDGTATHLVGEYAYAPGADQPIEYIAGGSSGPNLYVQDALGNVMGLVDSSMATTERLDYDPWGFTTSATGAVAATNRLRWKGLLWEGDSTQLYYVRSRWYDPQSRRFVSEDPLGLDGGVNMYGFAGEDPINGADPSGMFASFFDGCDPTGCTTEYMTDYFMNTVSRGACSIFLPCDPYERISETDVLGRSLAAAEEDITGYAASVEAKSLITTDIDALLAALATSSFDAFFIMPKNSTLKGCEEWPDRFSRLGTIAFGGRLGQVEDATYTFNIRRIGEIFQRTGSKGTRRAFADYNGGLKVSSDNYKANYFILSATPIDCSTGGGTFWGIITPF